MTPFTTDSSGTPWSGSPAATVRPAAASFSVDWAVDEDDIAEAQRLRFNVFAAELGARLDRVPGVPPAHDIDRFDAHCEHLLVRAGGAASPGRLIATCRLLSPEGAARAGGFYAETEFDLAPLRRLLPRTIEMGRVCIDPAWRNGIVLMAMWKAVGECMARRRLDTMIGCASVGMSDGGVAAGRIWAHLNQTHLAHASLRIRAKNPMTLETRPHTQVAAVPALMKGYLRCGAMLLGPPAVDTDFDTADFPMIVNRRDMPSRYARRLFAEAA